MWDPTQKCGGECIFYFDGFSEDDFAVLRGPLASGRQSPASLGGTLLLTPFLIGLLLGIGNFFVFGDRITPPHPAVVVICLVCDLFGLILMVSSIVFAFQQVYRKWERLQYLLTIAVIQSITGLLYLIALYVLYDGTQFHHTFNSNPGKMTIFIMATFIVGMLIFLAAFIRFYRLIKQGAFRKNTERDNLRNRLEERTDQFKEIGFIAGTSVVLIGGAMVRLFGVEDLEMLGMITLGITLFYVMMFILPEQLVIWYCKKRFRSFNFSKNNHIYPMYSNGEAGRGAGTVSRK